MYVEMQDGRFDKGAVESAVRLVEQVRRYLPCTRARRHMALTADALSNFAIKSIMVLAAFLFS